jgi:hypothetical protein
MGKKMRELRICALCDVAICRQQRLGVLKVKPRIGSQEFLEFVVVTFETRRGHDFFHLCPNSFYLGQTDFVDFLWCFICSRMPFHVVRIKGGPIREGCDICCFPAARQVLLDEKTVQLLERRHHLFFIRG